MKYFGTDGFRGKSNQDLKVEHALKIGQFLGWYFGAREGKKCRCVIGKDTRQSSYMYEYGLSAGLTSTGCDVYLLHVTTTPSVSYITRIDDFDFGIMITASHNPYYDNGIKIIDRNGYKMDESILEQVEEYIDGNISIDFASSESIGRCNDYIQGRNRYISYLSSIPVNSFRGYKVGLDCSNGSAFTIAKTVFDMLGADTYIINNKPDGTNINRDCGSTHIEHLAQYVRNNGLDMGFAFDGDADRCIAINEKGEIVDGDAIIYIAGNYLKEHGQLKDDTVVVTVMSNLGFFNAIKEKGMKACVTDVGDKYVSAEILANGYSVGGEQSGHVIFNKYATTGDGILTAILLADIVVGEKSMMSHLHAGLHIMPQKLKNIRVNNKKEIMESEKILKYIEDTNNKLSGSGRLLFRASGTEPLIRIMAEADSLVGCEKIISEAENYMNELFPV